MTRGLRGAVAARRAGKKLTSQQRRALAAAALRNRGRTFKGQGAKAPRQGMRQRLDSNKGGTWKGRADEVAGEKARLKDHWRDPAVINTAALGAGGAAIGGKLAYDAYKKRKGR